MQSLGNISTGFTIDFRCCHDDPLTHAAVDLGAPGSTQSSNAVCSVGS